MAVVGNDGAATVVKYVKAPGGGLSVVDERGQTSFDRLPVKAECPGCSDRCHGVFNLKADRALACEWDRSQGDLMILSSLAADDMAVIAEHDALALCAMSV